MCRSRPCANWACAPCRGSMSLGEADGGLPPQQTVQQGQVILDDSQRLIREYHQRGDGAQIQIALAPCSPFSVTPKSCKPVPSWPTSWTCACTPTWRKPSMRKISACNASGCVPWITSTASAGSAHAPGWPMAFTSTRTKSSAWRRRHRHLPLPKLEYAPGLRHLPYPGPACRRRPIGRCGRLGLQRRLEHDP